MLRNLNRSSARGRICGTPYVGVLGSVVPSTGTHGPGYMYESVIARPGYATKRYRGRITGWPAGLTLFPYEDSSFTASAPDGTYEVPWELWEFDQDSGAIIGTATFTPTFGQIEAGVEETALAIDSQSAILIAVASVDEAGNSTDAPDSILQTSAVTSESGNAVDELIQGGSLQTAAIIETASAIETINRLLGTAATHFDTILLADAPNATVIVGVSAKYRYTVEAANQTYTVATDDRQYEVLPDNRRFTHPAANHRYTV